MRDAQLQSALLRITELELELVQQRHAAEEREIELLQESRDLCAKAVADFQEIREQVERLALAELGELELLRGAARPTHPEGEK